MSNHQLVEMLSDEGGGLVAHTECYDDLGIIDMHVIDTGDRQVAVFVLSVDAAQAAVLRSEIKVRVDAGQTALASQLDALGLRTAVDTWAGRG
tara:strand:+ start:664 stop:942 length:279 start_codon:yes stop_codon:yes gene_type:complete